jgi:choline dehydrogenase
MLLSDQPKDGHQYASLLSALLAPLSRGTVIIKSASTADGPIIDPKGLSHTANQATAVAGYERVHAVFNSNFTSRVLGDKNEYYPGSSVQTDSDILSVIRYTLMTVW